jgi:hypothetical protein
LFCSIFLLANHLSFALNAFFKDYFGGRIANASAPDPLVIGFRIYKSERARVINAIIPFNSQKDTHY